MAGSRTRPLPRGGNAPVSPPLAPAPAPGASAGEADARLWLCLYFPRLPLEAVAPAAPATSGVPAAPRALLADDTRRPAVFLCDTAAGRLGIRPGLAVNAALALVPGLVLHDRDRHREAVLLGRLADRALRVTPLVSVEEPAALLLEVAASVPLFGSLDALHAAACADARAAGHAVQTAIAPTARGALWLARAGGESRAADATALAAALAPLPVGLPGWPDASLQVLRRMGVRRLGDCMRLPRDGLARRIGARCLLELDEALGRRAETRKAWRRAERLRAALDLPAETRDAGLLGAGVVRLLEQVQAGLRARQLAVLALELRLRHRARPTTALRVGLLRPSADVRHLAALVDLRLAALALPGPVLALAVVADVVDAAPGGGADLLGDPLDAGERAAVLVERLRTRLGLEAVHGLRLGREHRPERAWGPVANPVANPVVNPVAARAEADAPPAGAPRPLWFLEAPLALGAEPAFQGPLALDGGPERIETGWWDGGDVRRDYYAATNPRGLRLWVFQDRRAGGWYLHGLFG